MARTRPPGRNPAVWVAVSILIIIGIAGTLWVPIYARTTPKLGDFPFFYWYQLIWVPVVAILSWLAYLLLRPRTRAAGTDAAGAASDGGRKGAGR
jgi:membrane protein implicated in regulation of membrane protease activity